MTIPPVLLISFNRPEKTAEVLKSLQAVRPPRLYMACDGPREGRSGEAAKVAACHALAEDIDWPCEVFTQFQAHNLGCRRGVISAIDWFFRHEELGIILEDDILADSSFFSFCAELLELYRNEPRVMAITGCNFQPSERNYDHSYYFSTFNHVWGWASWRRAWEVYDKELTLLDRPEVRAAIEAQSDVLGFVDHWMYNFEAVRDGRIDSWAYGWMLSCWNAGGLTCTPRTNLIRNTGFGEDATHTHNSDARQANLVAGRIAFPLVHPDHIAQSRSLDDFVALHEYRIKPLSLSKRLKSKLRAARRRIRSGS